MMLRISLFCLFCLVTLALGSPAKPIIRKIDPLRYQYEQDDSGKYHLVDLWMTLDEVKESVQYEPLTNVYHLFTRANPSVSQPLVQGNEAVLRSSNYSNRRRTIVLIHGWMGSATSEFNAVLVPVLLAAEDVNVIVVDWSVGANTIFYSVAQLNSIDAAKAIGIFIDWLNQLSGSVAIQYHIIGHNLGGHMAGIAGRRLTGTVPYITGLDPSYIGWVNHPDRFQPNDGLYTEVIHTNVAMNGYLDELALVDFYPNGGETMPGCDSHDCDHARSYFYFAESVASGGFTGTRCTSIVTALLQTCILPITLPMGGLTPKPGFTGIYSVRTNASPPFSLG